MDFTSLSHAYKLFFQVIVGIISDQHDEKYYILIGYNTYKSLRQEFQQNSLIKILEQQSNTTHHHDQRSTEESPPLLQYKNVNPLMIKQMNIVI